ncbi:MAG: LON peptidase substrate-binding domain-containing protein [Candidatus Dormibacteraeota bacterium]|nr:LON peptidase substrate-binding domain-containing protein [Candidatus Dormibacteraeota bacterium]MBV9525101.1 LON peptidase substrate-binding domain-containing protein [Candidatus Dormibacteraeota bacterium]
MTVQLPLFPLSTVLFPHMPLALHVFEERYRAMMRDCREQGTTFGVLAIREGLEVGGGAVPYRVGTLAQLRDVEELPDGRYNLLVVGASRFRVETFSQERPYLTGEVRYLEDDALIPDDAALLAPRVRSVFQAYVAAMARFNSDAPASEISLPDEPELLAYLVAGALEIETARKQALLEHDSTSERLRGCLQELRRESVLLDRLATRRQPRVLRMSPN